MKIKVLHSSLDKGESWEERNKRDIEIVPSSDTPDVYFGIMNGNKIVQDFFFDTKTARKIGKELILLADKSDKKYKQHRKKSKK